MGFTAYRIGKDNEEVKRKDSFHLFPEQLCLTFPHVLTIFVMVKLMPFGNCAHMKFGNFTMVWYLILNFNNLCVFRISGFSLKIWNRKKYFLSFI